MRSDSIEQHLPQQLPCFIRAGNLRLALSFWGYSN